MAKALTFAAMLALAGCVTSGGSFCDIARPIRVTEQTIAAMTDGEVEAALAHNLKGQELCGWKR